MVPCVRNAGQGVYSVMAAKQTIEPGQCYRDIQPGAYGRSAASNWIVETIQTGTDHRAYARLVRANDSTVRKTLAVSELEDRRRFELVTAP
jgi:hypothetical protein